MFEHIDFTPGKLTYFDFDIQPFQSLDKQLFSLKQDMLQISFSDDAFIIDIGWTNDFSMEGAFRLVVIENRDWQNPLMLKETDDLSLLESELKRAIAFVKRML